MKRSKKDSFAIISGESEIDQVWLEMLEKVATVDLWQKMTHILILSSRPLSNRLKTLLTDKKFVRKVRYLEGDPLSTEDLYRCDINNCDSFFVLGRFTPGIKVTAIQDQIDVLRCWRVRNLNPSIKLFALLTIRHYYWKNSVK